MTNQSAEAQERAREQKAEAESGQLRELLELAYNGLKWYRDAHPEDDSGADDELYARINAVLSGEASAVQEAEAPNFCARCGKRLGAGIHTCSLPREDGAAVEGLTDDSNGALKLYAKWCEEQGIHSNRIRGWHELSLIERSEWVSKWVKNVQASDIGAVPMASSAGEPVADLLQRKYSLTREHAEAAERLYWELKASANSAPPAASLREQEAFPRSYSGGIFSTNGSGAGKVILNFDDVEQAEAWFNRLTTAIDAQRLGRGKEQS